MNRNSLVYVTTCNEQMRPKYKIKVEQVRERRVRIISQLTQYGYLHFN